MFYIDNPINRFRGNTLLRVLHPHPPFIPLRNLRPRRKARIQQNHPITVPCGYSQKLGARIYSRCTIFGRFSIRVQVGGRSICSLADGFLVVISIDNGLPVPNSYPALLQQTLPP